MRGPAAAHGGRIADPTTPSASARAPRWYHVPTGPPVRTTGRAPPAFEDTHSMARGINKVILVGNLGDDPETKYTQGGMAITSCSLATTSVRKDKDGNSQERTEWHRLKFFGKVAEIAGEYLRKGSQVYVEGSIRYDKFTGQDGVEKYFTDIVVDQMQMLGGRGDGGGGGGGGARQERSGGGDRPARPAPQRQERPAGAPRDTAPA